LNSVIARFARIDKKTIANDHRQKVLLRLHRDSSVFFPNCKISSDERCLFLQRFEKLRHACSEVSAGCEKNRMSFCVDARAKRGDGLKDKKLLFAKTISRQFHKLYSFLFVLIPKAWVTRFQDNSYHRFTSVSTRGAIY